MADVYCGRAMGASLRGKQDKCVKPVTAGDHEVRRASKGVESSPAQPSVAGHSGSSIASRVSTAPLTPAGSTAARVGWRIEFLASGFLPGRCWQLRIAALRLGSASDLALPVAGERKQLAVSAPYQRYSRLPTGRKQRRQAKQIARNALVVTGLINEQQARTRKPGKPCAN